MGKGESAATQPKARRGIGRRIMAGTAFSIAALVLVCASIMVFSMKQLTNTILLDTLQPMAKEASKTVEGNLHMLADRIMGIAKDSRLTAAEPQRADMQNALLEAKEIYEFYTIGLYDLNGSLVVGDGGAAQSIAAGEMFRLLGSTDNLVIGDPQLYGENLGLPMAMPVQREGKTAAYLVGSYKYDALNDVISNINVGRTGQAIIINQQGTVVGHPSAELVKQGLNVYTMDDNPSASRIFDRMRSGETGSAQGVVNGANAFVAFSPVRGTTWALAIQVPQADYMYMAYNAMLLTFGAAVVMMALAAVIIYRMSQKISSSVNTVTVRIGELAEGDLKSEVTVTDTQDELELLSRSLRHTVESINRYLSEIQQVLFHIAHGDLRVQADGEFHGDFVVVKDSLEYIVRSLNRTLHEISRASVRLSHTAEALSEQSGELQSASAHQSQSVNDLVGEVENIKENLHAVTSNTDMTRQKVGEITQKIAAGDQQMHELLRAMEEINHNANEISKISKLIEDIAFQTNILALNAAVEAAHAGSAGKGFAVVADEVRSLAAKSAEAAKNTTSMIAHSTAMITSGVSLAGSMATALDEISAVSDSIAQITVALSDTVHIQERSLEQITYKIEDISNITQQNLQSAQETASASSALSQEADMLKDLIGHFTLKEDDEDEKMDGRFVGASGADTSAWM